MRKRIRWIALFIVILIAFKSGFFVAAKETSAKSAVVINGDTGEMIFSENAAERLPMASTTKIMTALLLCEQNNFQKQVTVTEDMLKVEGSSMGLLPGDTVSFHDLLYGMLLASGNDAANVTAYAIDGSIEKFAERMNRKASELKLNDTHFVTPSGLDADGHYTTASDLAKLSFYALKNEEFAAAAASVSATLCFGNPPYQRTLKNHNKLLEIFDGAVGVKTGFTRKSGRCLVSAAKRDGKFVIAVTLDDPDDWADHQSLLLKGLNAITTTEYLPDTSVFKLPLIGGEQPDLEITVQPFKVNVSRTQDITSVIELPRFVYAPVAKGDMVGKITYYYAQEIIGSAPLIAGEEAVTLRHQTSFWDRWKENLNYLLAGLKET